MPFTPSHAVVALPFLRTPLIPAAVAVGAMTPDLPLFVRGTPLSYSRTHDFAWLPVTVLLALVLLLLWRMLLRTALLEVSPRAIASRLPSSWGQGARAAARETFSLRSLPHAASTQQPSPTWRGTAMLALSLLLGVASHIFWDLFTHEGRWGSEVLPVLDERWGPFTGYKWLQHVSSAVGLIVLVIWATLWLRARPRADAPRRVLPSWARAVWWASLPATLAVAVLIGFTIHGPFTAEWTPAHVAYQVLLPALAAWALLSVAAAGIVVGRRATSARER